MTEKKKSTIISEGSDKPNAPEHRHYIDNAAFYDALCQRRSYIENDQKVPKRLEDYIGECLMLIAQNLAKKWNFARYTWRDEMIDDAIVANLRALDKFDVNKHNNPLAYFTQCSYFAFIGRIESEEDATATKYRAVVESAATGQLDSADDEDSAHILDNLDVSLDYMIDFLDKYDQKQERKREKRRKSNKKSQPLNQLWEEGDEQQ